jgi:hypothetical protein
MSRLLWGILLLVTISTTFALECKWPHSEHLARHHASRLFSGCLSNQPFYNLYLSGHDVTLDQPCKSWSACVSRGCKRTSRGNANPMDAYTTDYHEWPQPLDGFRKTGDYIVEANRLFYLLHCDHQCTILDQDTFFTLGKECPVSSPK